MLSGLWHFTASIDDLFLVICIWDMYIPLKILNPLDTLI